VTESRRPCGTAAQMLTRGLALGCALRAAHLPHDAQFARLERAEPEAVAPALPRSTAEHGPVGRTADSCEVGQIVTGRPSGHGDAMTAWRERWAQVAATAGSERAPDPKPCVPEVSPLEVRAMRTQNA
jgi:hypothetical protein